MRRATACALLLILALGAGCGSDSKDEAAAARARAKAARHARMVAAGKPVFVKNCALCHTIEGRVAHPTFIESPIPNLDEVKPREAYVRTRVIDGGIDMGSFHSELSERQIAAVSAYVAEVSGGRVIEPDLEAAELARGEQLFTDNCQDCHGIDGRGRSGRPLFPGTDFNLVKPSTKFVLSLARRGIPEMMPSFRKRLSEEELQTLAAYVTATAGE